MQLWDVSSDPPQPLHTFSHGATIFSAAISTPVADKKQLLALGMLSGTIQLWDLTSDLPRQLQDLHAGTDAQSIVTALAFSKPTAAGNYDRLLLASGSYQTIHLWNLSVDPPELLYILEKEAVRSIDPSAIECSLAFSTVSDGKQLLVSSSSDGTMMLWNIGLYGPSLLQERQVGMVTNWVAFAKNGQWIETEHGPLDLSLSSIVGDHFLYVYQKDEWLMCGNKRLVWLPQVYESLTQAWEGNLLIVGRAYYMAARRDGTWIFGSWI